MNQFEEHLVAVKTEVYEMHYIDSGAPKVLQRRVQRVKLLPLFKAKLLKDRDMKEVEKNSTFAGCQMGEVGKSSCSFDSRMMKPTEVPKMKRLSGH
jgi:hypothetical protein